MKKTLLIAGAIFGLALPAWAGHPEPYQMHKVQVLAHQLEDAARHVHKTAEHYAHHYDRGEDHALKKLHRLDNRARHFHRQVERYHQNPYHTENDFRRLVDAYHEASYALDHLHGYDHVYRDFHRVQVAMDRLIRYYDGPGYGYRDHGRYRDHGHYRGHGRYRGYDRPGGHIRYRDRDGRFGVWIDWPR